jgi:hypothetical protein
LINQKHPNMSEPQYLRARFNAHSGNLIEGQQYQVIDVDYSRSLVRILSARQRQVWIPFHYFTGFIHPEFELELVNDCTLEPDHDPYAPIWMDVRVLLDDGRLYYLDVWNFAKLQAELKPEALAREEHPKNYLRPPDLLIRAMTRADLEEAIQDIICEGSLERVASKTDMGLVFIAPWVGSGDLSDEELEVLEQRLQACLTKEQHLLVVVKFSLYAYRRDTREVLLKSGKGELLLFILPEASEAPLPPAIAYDSTKVFWEKRYREEYRVILKNRDSK